MKKTKPAQKAKAKSISSPASLPPGFVSQARATVPLHVVPRGAFKAWLAAQAAPVAAWLRAHDFAKDGGPAAGRAMLWPDAKGNPAGAVAVCEDTPSIWDLAALPASLPALSFAPLAYKFDIVKLEPALLGYALAHYRFDRYRKAERPAQRLVWPKGCDAHLTAVLADAASFARDLINTPAEDLGPPQLAAALEAMAKAEGATCRVIRGEALLRENFPLVHIVGRGADRAPCLVDIRWGNAKHPTLTLVGKGVCFDTGGLDLKPSSNMILMKKDMGGAAILAALAQTIMRMKLPVRLRLIVPAVENSVSAASMRPSDVAKSRKGLSVEIGNTDAEGRLILADALTLAGEEAPGLIIDMATLTGAARVALGTELPALFCNNDDVAAEMLAAANDAADPLWRLPLFAPYNRFIRSNLADITNNPSTGQGGAITAALFLQNFVPQGTPWAHIDVMAWNTGSQPGRPEGGEAMGLRALYNFVARRYPRAT